MIYILLYGAGFICIAYGIGSIVLRLFANNINNTLEEFICSIGLGLAVLGYSVYITGSLGYLYTFNIIIMIAVYVLISIKPVWRLLSRVPWGRIPGDIVRLGLFDKFLLALIIFVPFICLFGVSAPAIGNDALVYHLYHPKVFIQNHTIGHIPFTRESLWPYLTEMLFTLGLMIQGAELAKFFHWLFGVLSVVAVFSFVNNFFSKRQGLLAAALFCLAPGIFMQSVYAYIDLALCFYSFMALYMLVSWQKHNRTLFLVLSAIFTGLAMSVKMLGGFTLIALCTVILIMAMRKNIALRDIVKSIFIFVAISAILSAVWYIRSYVVLGNPVYPFMNEIFKKGWPTGIGKMLGTRRDIIGFLRLPWDLVIHFDRFGAEQIGVISLAFLPFVFFIPLKTRRELQCIILFGFVNAVLWFIVAPTVRYLFVDMAIVYILIAVGFNNAGKFIKLSFLRILLCLFLLFNASLCLYYNRDAIRLQIGMMGKEEYLFNKERTYPVAEFINKNLSENSVLIMAGEPRSFYFNRKVISCDLWQNISGKDIISYITELKKNRIPVYALYREDAACNSIESIIKGKVPIYCIKREVNEAKLSRYCVFKL